jgi:DNA mismatch repair protein MSH5
MIVDGRLDILDTFVRPDNATQLADIGKELKSIKNMHTVTLNLQRGVSASKGGISNSIWSIILKVHQSP